MNGPSQIDEEQPQEQALTESAELVPEKAGFDVDPSDIGMFDLKLYLSEKQKSDIVCYLDDNLPRMRPDSKEKEKILGQFAMYEMAIRKRNFPYENAPSLASSDAYDKMNEWLDTAESAFLMSRTAFTVDREEVNLPEESINRIERTYHRRFFQKVFQEELRTILFEAGFLGVSICSVEEVFDIRPVREKIVIRSDAELRKNALNLTESQYKQARTAVAEGKPFVSDTERIEFVNVGPQPKRIDQTKFWYPRNTKFMKDWQICAEEEFYTKSALRALAKKGEIDGGAVERAIENRKMIYAAHSEDKMDELPESVMCNRELDSTWIGEASQIKQLGDAYEDEFAVYKVTMKYGLRSDSDTDGALRTWIQVRYLPASRSIISASFCRDGRMPYYLIRYRPVPHKTMSGGIAQARYSHNSMDTEIKSLFLASVEQEVGAPLLIRKTSSLWASGYRCYPGSVGYADDPERDVVWKPFPDKSRIAANAVSMVLGSSPMSNLGAGYASGKREDILQQQKQMQFKARLHSIAMDLDEVYNAAWRIHCRLAKFNTESEKVVDFVHKEPPVGVKLYILENEMDPGIVWTSVASATSMSPDIRLQKAMMRFQIFHKDVPVSVNNPKMTISWLNHLADYYEFDDQMKKNLLPTMEDFQQYQAQLGAMGGQRPNEGEEPPQKAKAQGVTPLTAQSSATPFHRPAK